MLADVVAASSGCGVVLLLLSSEPCGASEAHGLPPRGHRGRQAQVGSQERGQTYQREEGRQTRKRAGRQGGGAGEEE